MGIADTSRFDCVEEGGRAEGVVDSTGTLWAPSGEIEFGGVMEGGYRNIVVGGEVCEGAIGEGMASDGSMMYERVWVCRGQRVSWRSPKKYVRGSWPRVPGVGMAATR